MAKGEDMDALKETVNAHIGDDYIHVTAIDKENWNGKADLSLLDTEGYLKKKLVGALRRCQPNLILLTVFLNSTSRTAALQRSRRTAGKIYQKITTASMPRMHMRSLF